MNKMRADSAMGGDVERFSDFHQRLIRKKRFPIVLHNIKLHSIHSC